MKRQPTYTICKPCPVEPEFPEIIIDRAAHRRCAKYGCGTILRSDNRGELCEACRRKAKGIDNLHKKAEALPRGFTKTFSATCNGCGREISLASSVYYGGLCGVCYSEQRRQAKINRPPVDMDAAVECYSGGEWSVAFVAKKFGMATLRLRNELIHRGVEIRGKGLSNKKRAEILRYLMLGATCKMVVEKYKVSTTTIRHIVENARRKEAKA